MTFKNATFAIGLGWLIYGALYFGYGDWDIGISLVMACSTYLCADWVWSSLVARQYARWPLAALLTWWCVDGSYWLYWSLVEPDAMFREGQWMMSLCLFLLAGFVWTTDLAMWLRALAQCRSSCRAVAQGMRAWR